VVRTASSGYSMIVDPRGVVLAQARTQQPETIVGRVGLRDELTFYVRWGWLLPRLCLVLAALAVLVARRRNSPEAPASLDSGNH
jgi:apolipoprotein N-acyltransferase